MPWSRVESAEVQGKLRWYLFHSYEFDPDQHGPAGGPFDTREEALEAARELRRQWSLRRS